MSATPQRHPGDVRPLIHRLPPDAVNRIAAGEVIERPAAAVKELAENALDAGATSIDCLIEDGGRACIQLVDNGCGMTRDMLPLALERHATSKLVADDAGDYDLLHITTMGFRGEALPSIGSVARLSIASRVRGEEGWQIACEAGTLAPPSPVPFAGHGTRVQVRDLFYATPARLKFLKSERAETMAVAATLKALAMARPDVAFSLTADGRQRFAYAAQSDDVDGHLRRLAAIMGREFGDNAIPIDAEREDIHLTGFAGLPTFNRGQADRQYLFVNGRPVKDRLLLGALRGAYADFLARDRHPQVALFLAVPYDKVDVNVHPAKSEVRFRDSGLVRGLIVSGLRHALAEAGHRASTTVANYALGRARPAAAEEAPTGRLALHQPRPQTLDRQYVAAAPSQGFAEASPSFDAVPPSPSEDDERPLGVARAQLHETYIVAQTADGIVIVDQHAAHERLVYERMKTAMARDGVPRQRLLVPEVVELPQDEAEAVLSRMDELAALGLVVDTFGDGAILVREVPSLLDQGDVQGLVRDIAADLLNLDASHALTERLQEICGNIACRGSIRAGRRLDRQEMDHLLREMEATPHSGQCNHGRPTYVELKLADIERLFGRR
jgi:DNA mismatch repair protein MutL